MCSLCLRSVCLWADALKFNPAYSEHIWAVGNKNYSITIEFSQYVLHVTLDAAQEKDG